MPPVRPRKCRRPKGDKVSRFYDTEFGLLRRVNRDGIPTVLLACPGCGEWGTLDDDQLHGRISVDHAFDGCPAGYHEMHDFAAAMEKVVPTDSPEAS